MQINENKKEKSHDKFKHNVVDNDFKDLLHEGNSNKSKPVLIALGVVITIIITASWSVLAHPNQSNRGSDTHTTDPSQAEKNVETTVDQRIDEPTTQGVGTTSPTTSDSPQPSQATNNNTYDPGKCEPLNSEATRLRQSADQKKITYDNAFATRKNYGYFYDKYGNTTDAQQSYNAQEAQLNQLQTDWQEALNKGNAAYTKYQECRASL